MIIQLTNNLKNHPSGINCLSRQGSKKPTYWETQRVVTALYFVDMLSEAAELKIETETQNTLNNRSTILLILLIYLPKKNLFSYHSQRVILVKTVRYFGGKFANWSKTEIIEPFGRIRWAKTFKLLNKVLLRWCQTDGHTGISSRKLRIWTGLVTKNHMRLLLGMFHHIDIVCRHHPEKMLDKRIQKKGWVLIEGRYRPDVCSLDPV